MSEQAQTTVIVNRFDGLASAVDPLDLAPSYSTAQENCYSPRVGELISRRGLRQIAYEAEL